MNRHVIFALAVAVVVAVIVSWVAVARHEPTSSESARVTTTRNAGPIRGEPSAPQARMVHGKPTSTIAATRRIRAAACACRDRACLTKVMDRDLGDVPAREQSAYETELTKISECAAAIGSAEQTARP